MIILIVNRSEPGFVDAGWATCACAAHAAHPWNHPSYRSRYPPAKAEGRHASQVFKICVEWPGVVSGNREEQSWPQGQVKFKIVVTHPL